MLAHGPLAELFREIDVPVTEIERGRMRNPISTFNVIRALTREIRSHRVDLVFGNITQAHVYGSLAARYCAVRVKPILS